MRAWIRPTLQTMSVFALSWGGAMYYWRGIGQMPSTIAVVTLMIALPLAVLGGLWLTQRLRAPGNNAPAAPAASAGAAAGPSAPLPALAILRAAIHTAHGPSTAELAAAIGERRARPTLDPELVDEYGFPVLSARIADLAIDAMLGEVEPWCRTQNLPPPRFHPEQWRALSLGSATIADLVHEAARQQHMPTAMLQVHLILPAWEQATLDIVLAWIGHTVEQAGWPRERISMTVASDAAAGAAATLDQMSSVLAASEMPALALVAAFDSQIGQASIDLLSARGALFGQRSSQGLVPGEGAAALLLANSAAAQLIDPEAVQLHPARALRSTDADKARRPDATALLALLEQACRRGATEPAALGAVVCDSGQRSSRVMEVMALANQGLPHLDAGTDVSSVGNACGACGAVPLLAALALAQYHVQQTKAPVLCVGNDDSLHRSAMLLRPAPKQT